MSCTPKEEQTKCRTRIQNISGSGGENIAGNEMRGGECNVWMSGRDTRMFQKQRQTSELLCAPEFEEREHDPGSDQVSAGKTVLTTG